MGKNLLILIFLAFAAIGGAQTYDLNATVAVEAAANAGAKAMTLTELKSIVASGLGTGSVTSVNAAVSGLTAGTAVTTSGNITLAYAGLTGIVKGTNAAGFSTAIASDFPLLNQNTSGTAAGLSTTLAVGSGGTGATTLTGLIKGVGTGALIAATAGSDYLAPFTAQSAAFVYAGPATGGSLTPTFRALVATDVPTLNQNTAGTAANVTGTVAIANGGTGSTTQNFVDLSTAQASIAGNKTFTARTTIGGGLIYTTTAVGAGTSAWTLTIDGSKSSYEVTGTGNGTITLTAGLTVAVKIKCNSGSITVNASGSETINGNATFTVSALSNNRKLIIEAGSTTDNLAGLY